MIPGTSPHNLVDFSDYHKFREDLVINGFIIPPVMDGHTIEGGWALSQDLKEERAYNLLSTSYSESTPPSQELLPWDAYDDQVISQENVCGLSLRTLRAPPLKQRQPNMTDEKVSSVARAIFRHASPIEQYALERADPVEENSSSSVCPMEEEISEHENLLGKRPLGDAHSPPEKKTRLETLNRHL